MNTPRIGLRDIPRRSIMRKFYKVIGSFRFDYILRPGIPRKEETMVFERKGEHDALFVVPTGIANRKRHLRQHRQRPANKSQAPK